MGWWSGSSSKAPTKQAWGPDSKPQYTKKKKEKERLTMFLLLLSALHTDYVNIMSYILLSFPFYRVGKWGTERLSNSTNVTWMTLAQK
jgi:hypothetical protein